jgi:hypothetical protein
MAAVRPEFERRFWPSVPTTPPWAESLAGSKDADAPDASEGCVSDTTADAPIVLMRTWAVLKDREKIESPGEVPGLVDRVYEAETECPPGWEEAWRKGHEQLAYSRDHEKKIAAAMYLPTPHAVDHLSALIERSRNPGTTRKSRGDRR